MTVILAICLVSPAPAGQVPPNDRLPLRQKCEAVGANPVKAQHVEESEKKEPVSPNAGLSKPGFMKAFEDRFGPLSINGRVVGYYQGANNVKINDQEIGDNKGFGYTLDLELTWKPLRSGQLYLRIHNGYGKGADNHLRNYLLANLNTIADDNDEYGDGVQLIEAYYTQRFLKDNLFVSLGKTDLETFIDDNVFANDQNTQFVGKPFVNNPLIDTINEYIPTLALGGSLTRGLEVVALAQTMNRPSGPVVWQEKVGQNLFDDPSFSIQMTHATRLRGLKGNYRLYGMWETYQYKDSQGQRHDKVWAVGLSLDQKVHEKVGLFARGSYGRRKSFGLRWFCSVGGQVSGIFPSRRHDVFGMGVAGVGYKQHVQGQNSGLETHFEAYYRIVLNDYFAITPDIQCVIDPAGKSDNDTIIAGMLRGEFKF